MLPVACFWMSFVIVTLSRFAIKEILGIEIDPLYGWLMIIGLTSSFNYYFQHRKKWG
ncbi:hypothetical protein [Crocosphaera chwakensis]|uniref:Uncharacterized protein n=1 Tax=Crocosphaera chwakensis CCY0110 TaxID=391612 RepID=A3IZ10_9CHRO|nr:hypothetical protein [Crocosphaera chwakensis]EAZ88277.1 hypothetical protein CY0110_14525 [Crocosphaera chwakensis CCY0110]